MRRETCFRATKKDRYEDHTTISAVHLQYKIKNKRPSNAAVFAVLDDTAYRDKSAAYERSDGMIVSEKFFDRRDRSIPSFDKISSRSETKFPVTSGRRSNE